MKIQKSLRNIGMALLLFLPLVFAPIALADQPTILTANFSFNITPTSVSTDGGNTVTTFADFIVLTGGAAGTVNCAGVLTAHPDGTYNFGCDGSYTGTVTGGSGPGTASVHFTGIGSGVSAEGNEVWDHGTGGLEGLHAQISFVATFTSATGGSGVKTMQVQFDP